MSTPNGRNRPDVPDRPSGPEGPEGAYGSYGPGAPGRERVVLYVHFDLRDTGLRDAAPGPGTAADTGTDPGAGAGGVPAVPGEREYRGLLELLAGFTPVVQALPPDAAFAEVSGALRYFRRDAAGLAALVRLRAAAAYGVRCTVGTGPNPLLARIAAQSGPPGAVRCAPVGPEAIAAYLDPLPVAALPGAGPATVRTLAPYGLRTIGQLARVPPLTLQRILGAPAGRRLGQYARGIDPAPVTPAAPPRAFTATHDFGRDELDPRQHHRALLACAEELGWRLRGEHRTARSLTLTVGYADRSATTRSRSLPEPTAHSRALAETAQRICTSLALQRARVRTVTLRAEGIEPAESAAHQLSFDPADESARRIEAAADRARARFGPAAVRPAALAGLPTAPYEDGSRSRTPGSGGGTGREGRGRRG
jgi:DNA polymerase IV